MPPARPRWLAFAFPLALVACKKETPAPAGSASTAPLAVTTGAAPVAAGSGLAILKDFEGKISWAAKGKLAGASKDASPVLALALLVKAGKFRLDLPPGLGSGPGASAYLLGRPQEKKFYVVTDAQKQALLLDADRLGTQLDALAPKHGDSGAEAPPEVKKTGKLESVAGYSCEVWQITHQGSRTDACIASEGTDWLKLPVSKMPPTYSWASELTDGKHFPLRFVAFDRNGVEEGRVELTGIEKQPVDSAKLEVPAGYQVVDLDQMLGGLMQGLAGVHGAPGLPSLKGLPLPNGLPSARVPPREAKSAARPAATPKKH